MENEKSIQDLMAQYDAAEDAEDWDLCRALEDTISQRTKNFKEIKALFDWRVRAFLEDYGMPPFTLEYHADHPDYDFNEGHYHIEIYLGCFLSQWDLEYLIKEVLGIIVPGYASFTGAHFHFFEDCDTMDKIVKDLNEIFGLAYLMS